MSRLIYESAVMIHLCSWRQWCKAALFARSSYISVDTVFVTVKLGYNTMKRTEYFVLL